MSTLGLNYFSKFNSVVKHKLVADTDESREATCRWIDREVMEVFEGICETDVFNNPKALAVLTDIVMTFHASLDTIVDEFVQHEVDYLLDIPYQLDEAIKETPQVPWFYRRGYHHEEKGHLEKASFSVSERGVSVSYTIGKRR